jgi:ACS family hexuronate transporter-like MFS transporter
MKIPALRWWIAVLLFGAAVLNYVDRQVLSTLAPTIQRDLGMDDRDYANIVNLFLVAYTLAYLVAGRLTDRIGTRASMAVFVTWWSLANAFTAAAQGVRSMGGFRFALGLGEAGVWPAASKAVSEWFPARERALAIGFYTMGATVGATLAPYVIIPLAAFPYATHLPALGEWLGAGTGWRMAFIITGLLGFIWLVPWIWLYRTPKESKLITEAELQLITAGDKPEQETAQEKSWSWGQILANPLIWLLLVSRLLTDSVWYFFQFWFPKYLSAERHLPQEQLTITWVIYAAAGAGSLIGGWLSGRLVKRGLSPARSRLWVMLGCAALMPLSPAIATIGSLNLSLVVAAVVVFAALAWLINVSALIVDLIPRHSLGTSFSLIAAGSTVGGIVMNTLVAAMVAGPSTRTPGFLDQTVSAVFGPILQSVQGGGYLQWFWVAAFLHPLATACLWFGCRRRAAA